MARPSFSPSAEQRRSVKAMAGLGMRHQDIAVVLEIAEKTLRKHFRVELARGKVNQLRCQAADWQAGGLHLPSALTDQIRDHHSFSDAQPVTNAFSLPVPFSPGVAGTIRFQYTNSNAGPDRCA